MSWIEPITSHADGESYGYEDMNRVGNDILYIAAQLNTYGYTVTVSPKTNWTQGEIPTPTQISQYLTDLTALKNRFYGTGTIPASMDDFSETEANNIEKLLKEIETHITNMLAAFRYCGELIIGEAQ